MSDRILQTIFTAFTPYLERTPQPLKKRKAIYAITHCRKRSLGVSYFSCKDNHEVIEQLHSCRHRSCSLCAQKQRREWIEAQKSRLLSCPHFHVVFTLPHEYLSLWRYNEVLFTQILFRASQETLLTLVKDHHRGITPGLLIALHTWGRQLTLHPHTHCLITAGGLNSKNEWQPTGEFLLPIHVVKALYRGKVQGALKAAFESKELTLPPDLSVAEFWRLYRSVYQKPWSVRIEEQYAHGKGVVIYLARYFKGGPLNPNQIKACTDKAIEFSYRDHRDQRIKRLRLPPADFLQRLLTHVPANGTHTVRYYGLYAGCAIHKRSRCQAQMGSLQAIKGEGFSLRDAVLLCRQCGEPLSLTYSERSRSPKGNSFINDEASVWRDGAGGFVQQDVVADIATQFRQGESRR